MLAEELIELERAPRMVPPFSARYAGLTAEGGYEAARALHQHRLAEGWKPAGRKIGFTNRGLWARYGVHEPIWGMVYDRTLVFASEDSCDVPLAGLIQPRIEPEICVRLKSVPAPERLLESIEWFAHAIEIVQCRHPGWKVTLADSTADNGLHGRLIVGTPVSIEEIQDVGEKLPAVELVLYRFEKPMDRGTGANVLGSPLLALRHFVELLARQPKAPPLAAGDIVTTGTLTDAHPVAAGETWRTEIHGLPLHGLEIRFA